MQKSRQWWKEHYDKYLLSELSIAAYSIDNNKKKSTFYSWIKKFRSENIENKSTDNKKKNVVEKAKPTKIEWAAVEPIALNNEAINENTGLKITIGRAIVEINKAVDPKLLGLGVKVLMENA